MTDASSIQPEIELRRYWDILVARWPVVLMTMGLGLLISALYLVVVPSTFVATTTVSVFPITTDPYAANRNSSNLIDMSAEAVTASSFMVAEIAADGTGGAWDTTQLRRATAVTPGSDSTTMTITVEAASEERARAGASAMAEAYLQARSDQAASSIDSVVERDRDRIEEHREQLTDAIERLAAAQPGSPAAAEASSDQQTLNLQISALLARISSLEGIDTTGGAILNPASMTGVTVKPSWMVVLATGLAAGLGVGVIASFLTHSRRKKVTTPRNLRRELELVTLGELAEADVVLDSPAVASIAQRVLRMGALNDARVVTVLFDAAAPWPSVLAESLAASMRESGTSAVVASSPTSLGDVSGDVVLLPVAPDASHAERLHALRVSDVVVFVAGVGKTSIRSLATHIADAAGMGARVIGAVLVTGAERLATPASSAPDTERSADADQHVASSGKVRAETSQRPSN